MANAGVWRWADAPWRDAGLALLLGAVASLAATAWLRQRWLREYRTVRRLVGS